MGSAVCTWSIEASTDEKQGGLFAGILSFQLGEGAAGCLVKRLNAEAQGRRDAEEWMNGTGVPGGVLFESAVYIRHTQGGVWELLRRGPRDVAAGRVCGDRSRGIL